MTVVAELSTTAIVHSGGFIRFVATAATLDGIMDRLARYVDERCDDVLWPDAARRVRALLNASLLTQAVELYFEHTGERWDRERLDLVTAETFEYWSPDRERMADARR